MNKKQLIKAVLDNPTPACMYEKLTCRNNNDYGRLEPGYEEGWKYVSTKGGNSFYVTDKFLEEVIWKHRRGLWRLYKPIPIEKSKLYKEFELEDIIGITREDQKNIEELYSSGLLVVKYEATPTLTDVVNHKGKTIAEARFKEGLTWFDLPYTWIEEDEEGNILDWGDAFKGNKEDFVKYIEDKYCGC